MIRSAIKTDNIRSRSHAMTVTIADFARAGLEQLVRQAALPSLHSFNDTYSGL